MFDIQVTAIVQEEERQLVANGDTVFEDVLVGNQYLKLAMSNTEFNDEL